MNYDILLLFSYICTVSSYIIKIHVDLFAVCLRLVICPSMIPWQPS